MQGEVTRHGLHVVPLKQPREQVIFFFFHPLFVRRLDSRAKRNGEAESYRLHEHIVFAKEESHPAVLMQGLDVLAGRRGGGRALVYAAAGVSLLDLRGSTDSN